MAGLDSREIPEKSTLRSSLISELAQFGDTEVIAHATRLFDGAVTNGAAPLPAATRSAIIEAVGVGANRARFDRLLMLLKSTDSEEDRWTYAEALAGVRDETLASMLLAATIEPGIVPNIAATIPGMMAARSPHGSLAYQFTLDHWPKLAAIAGDTFRGRSRLLPSAAASFNESARAKQLIADQERKAGPDDKVPAQRVASRIELHADVRSRAAAALDLFLATWKPKR